MINENNELIITTPEAMEVIRIIKKINMKDDISNAISKFSDLNAKKENKLNELRELIIKNIGFETYESLSELEKEGVTHQILNENIEFKSEFEKTMVQVNRDISGMGMELIYNFAMRIPDAEKEIYKALAKIFNKPIKYFETQEFDVAVEQIKQISQSKTLLKLFSLATK
ncbi:hypothetical protein [Clostridium culturomicium]|uniref:hypothetical protein n=1 Tax=Clostridium culturomicium TaxID=1499683 RepID=UPI0005903D88|nr:hypothetical protein [Clostridium culturomicium]